MKKIIGITMVLCLCVAVTVAQGQVENPGLSQGTVAVQVVQARSSSQASQQVPVKVPPKEIAIDLSKIKISPVAMLPDYITAYNELKQAMDTAKHRYSDYWYITETYKSYVKHCESKNYSIQDQQAAGCKGTDTVDECMKKLYTWCCQKQYRATFEDRHKHMVEAMENLAAKSKAYSDAVAKIHQILAP